MVIVQVTDKRSGAVLYLARGRLVQRRDHATVYAHPSGARRAIDNHRLDTRAKLYPFYEYEQLPAAKPKRIKLYRGGWAKIV